MSYINVKRRPCSWTCTCSQTNRTAFGGFHAFFNWRYDMHHYRLLFFLTVLILFSAGIMAAQPVGGAKFWQLTATPGKPSAPIGFGPSAFAGPPATMAESSLSKASGRVTLPPASISVYELAVKW